MCTLELLHQPIDDALVPVVATKVSVTVGALHFENSITNFKNGNIEGSAAEVEHQNCFVL